MRHLALPFFCAVLVGLLLALLAWALRNQVEPVALACAIGAVFFAWRCWEDLNTTWPAFKAETQRRTAERQRAPLTTPTEQPPARVTGLRAGRTSTRRQPIPGVQRA